MYGFQFDQEPQPDSQEEQLRQRLAQLENETVALRQQLFDSKEEIFELRASISTIETDAKVLSKKAVDGLQSELNFKVSGRSLEFSCGHIV
jgi:uncharacterized protein YlxW (UPF0749 family)